MHHYSLCPTTLHMHALLLLYTLPPSGECHRDSVTVVWMKPTKICSAATILAGSKNNFRSITQSRSSNNPENLSKVGPADLGPTEVVEIHIKNKETAAEHNTQQQKHSNRGRANQAIVDIRLEFFYILLSVTVISNYGLVSEMNLMVGWMDKKHQQNI